MIRIVDITEKTDNFVAFALMYSNDNYLGVVFRENLVNLVRVYESKRAMMGNMLIKDVPAFIADERSGAKLDFLFKSHVDQVRLAHDLVVPVPCYVFDEELAEKLVETIERYKASVAHKTAVLIQKHVRGWIARRRFTKERMYLIIQLSALPPKYVAPHFPGGSIYRRGLKEFTELAKICRV